MLASERPRSNIVFMLRHLPMRTGTPWLATLRKRRRSIALALLPTLALWAMSGSACLAMLTAATPAQPQAEHSAAAHAGPHAAADHDDHGHAPAPAPAECPHCPPAHAVADRAHPSCSTTGESSTGNTPQKSFSQSGTPLFAVAHWLLPVTSAIPPLIAGLPPGTVQRPARVPLNIRHCVFLI